MMYHFHTLLKIILALSFLALNAVADDSSLIDVQAQGNQIIASGWTLDEGSTNEPGLQQASDLPPPVVNNESPLLSDEKDCADLQRRAAPGKLKRLRFAKREQQLSCPFQEFSGPSAREQPIPPPGGSEFNPDRKTRPTTMKKLINEKLLRPIVDVSVCGFQEGLDIPICAPRSVKSPYASVLLLHPCRFCEWIFSCNLSICIFQGF